jgi:hypothetical protein
VNPGDTIAWEDGIIRRAGIVDSVGVDGWWAWGGSGDRHWVAAWCICAPDQLDQYCADLARERAKAQERIAAMPAPVVPAPAPRRVHVEVETWVHVPGTRWWLGRSGSGVYLHDDGDSMRDVTRSPDPQTGLDGVRRWSGAGLMRARAVRELDHDARREVWGGRPDVAMQIVEVVL